MSCSRKVFGLDDSERTLCSLDMYFGGFNSLINGFVSTPNTWVNSKITDPIKTGLWQKKKLQIHFLYGRGVQEITYNCAEKNNTNCAGDHDSITRKLSMA
jgi:hypothetical protein